MRCGASLDEGVTVVTVVKVSSTPTESNQLDMGQDSLVSYWNHEEGLTATIVMCKAIADPTAENGEDECANG